MRCLPLWVQSGSQRGAMISGVYFDDTSSSVSDSANLVAGVGEVDLDTQVRQVSIMSAVALTIALVVFGVADDRRSFVF